MENLMMNSMEKRIQVIGKGKLSVKPDLIRLFLDLDGTDADYSRVLEMSSQSVDGMKNCFEELGFARSDLKTVSFHVDTKYEGYEDAHHNWRQRLVGYEYRHSLKVEFEADQQLLGEILYALSKRPEKPEFRIVYTVKDVEAAKNQLLGKAVADSREKAQVLAAAAGVELGAIASIQYSWGEGESVAGPVNRMAKTCMAMADGAASYAMEMEPEEIEVTDTVTIMWYIV